MKTKITNIINGAFCAGAIFTMSFQPFGDDTTAQYTANIIALICVVINAVVFVFSNPEYIPTTGLSDDQTSTDKKIL